MADFNLEKFWEDDELAHEERCFSKKAPQVALGIRMGDECVFAELGEEGNQFVPLPRDRRIELNKRYNEKALKIVGRKLLREEFPEPDSEFPAFRRIGEVFGGQYIFNGTSEWLTESCSTPGELEKLLDRVERLSTSDLREFILPANWESEKKRIFEKYGKKPRTFGGIRGPVTLATSIYGSENLIFLIYDEPDLAKRFSEAICSVILKYAVIFIEEAGYTKDNFPHGFGFNDDNCCLLTPDMYELFGAPILKKVFETFSPNPEDRRYQHSDSAMGHIVPILARFNLTGCNFGPTVLISHIRKYMKNTTIEGVISPITFMNNDEKSLVAEVKRDCEMARENDIRGVNLNTAGSINDGSRLTSMRLIMETISEYGRY